MQDYFNPVEGLFFDSQPGIIKKAIRAVISKIRNLKAITSRTSTVGGPRYKITEEMVKEFIFELMESPLIVFFRNLFTQKRKLGPQTSHHV